MVGPQLEKAAHGMRAGLWLAAMVAAGFAAAWAGPAGARPVPDACTESATTEDRLDSVGIRGEIVLAKEGPVVLSGLRWPDDEALAAAATAWLDRRRGQTILLTRRGETDRWGRARVDAVAGEDEPDDLALGLIAAGLAPVDPGEGDALCRPDLLKAEAGPRAARLGFWAEQPLSALDGTGLTSRAGRFVVAEGRVASVRERRNRTYLNFAGRGEPGLSVTVMKRTWRIMLERGLTAESLEGRSVRVRGTVEIWRGPMFDIVSPDMIELLDGERALRR